MEEAVLVPLFKKGAVVISSADLLVLFMVFILSIAWTGAPHRTLHGKVTFVQAWITVTILALLSLTGQWSQISDTTAGERT